MNIIKTENNGVIRFIELPISIWNLEYAIRQSNGRNWFELVKTLANIFGIPYRDIEEAIDDILDYLKIKGLLNQIKDHYGRDAEVSFIAGDRKIYFNTTYNILGISTNREFIFNGGANTWNHVLNLLEKGFGFPKETVFWKLLKEKKLEAIIVVGSDAGDSLHLDLEALKRINEKYGVSPMLLIYDTYLKKKLKITYENKRFKIEIYNYEVGRTPEFIGTSFLDEVPGYLSIKMILERLRWNGHKS